ncbi:MAG: hypothetical protein M3Y27_08420 [Acidobacteriota bacterium]|nr:hypothetical protein [Acidobacteriota bacterium]
MAVSRRLSGVFCVLALASFTAACKKNKTAAIPAPPPVAQRVPTTKRAQTHTSAVRPASPPAAVVAPQLGQMLSSTEERQYNAAIDQSLSRAQEDLNLLSNRHLTADQQSSLHEIQELIRQANATRKVDLISARALADKAQVLARDLGRNVK